MLATAATAARGAGEEMNDTVHIQGDDGNAGLFFTKEKVVGGLMDLLRRGHVDEAVEVFSRCTQNLGDALADEARGDVDLLAEVANVLFRSNDFVRAAMICEEIGQVDKAALLFERGEDAGNAARLYQKLGDDEHAAQMLERDGAFADAGKSYGRVGENARAAACYARAGFPLQAGEHYLAAGRPELAVAHLQEVGADQADFDASSELLVEGYVQLGVLDRAQKVAKRRAGDVCNESTFANWKRWAQIALQRNDADEALYSLGTIEKAGFDDDSTRAMRESAHALGVDIKNERKEDAEQQPDDVVPMLEGFAHLRSLSLFRALSLKDLHRVHAISNVETLGPGEFLLLEGQPAPGMWLVLDGEVAVRQGKVEIARLGAGAHVGEMSLVDGGPASADVVAVDGEVRALRIERAGFERLLATNDHLALGVTRVLLREMCSRLRKTSAIVAGRD